MYKKIKLLVILRGGYAYSRGYVYCFCQMFQGRRLFKGVRLFRSLEYANLQGVKIYQISKLGDEIKRRYFSMKLMIAIIRKKYVSF